MAYILKKANLEKKALDFKATHALMTDLKNAGVRIKRNTEGLNYYEAATKTVNMSRSNTPRASFFHEGGHALDPNLRQRTIGTPAPTILKEEQAANSIARHYIAKHSRPENKLINDATYVKNNAPGYKSYKLYDHTRDAMKAVEEHDVNPVAVINRAAQGKREGKISNEAALRSVRAHFDRSIPGFKKERKRQQKYMLPLLKREL